MSKLFFYDTETTGVRFWKNGIHQISGAIVIDDEIKERFDFKVKPVEGCLIEPEALEVSGITPEQLETYEPMRQVFFKIETMLSKYVDKFNKKDKFTLVGYNNASFDNQFFRAFFTQNATTEKEKAFGNYFGSWFWSDSWDVMVLASHYLREERKTMVDFKQSTVAKQLGIEVDESKLHDAEYDIDICMEIFKIVTKK